MKRCSTSDPNSEETQQWGSLFRARPKAFAPETLTRQATVSHNTIFS